MGHKTSILISRCRGISTGPSWPGMKSSSRLAEVRESRDSDALSSSMDSILLLVRLLCLCFLYDVATARTISSVVNSSVHYAGDCPWPRKSLLPTWLLSKCTGIAKVRSSRMFAGRPRKCQSFSSLLEELWHLLGLTLAPAEWKFPLHQGALPPADPKELRKQQIILTEHIHNVLQALIRRLVTEDGDALAACGIAKIQHWVMRFEFQKRGTTHIHGTWT